PPPSPQQYAPPQAPQQQAPPPPPPTREAPPAPPAGLAPSWPSAPPEPAPVAEDEPEPEPEPSKDEELADLPEDFELVEDESVSPEEEPEIELAEEAPDDAEPYEEVPTIDDLLDDLFDEHESEPAAEEQPSAPESAAADHDDDTPHDADEDADEDAAHLLDYLSTMATALPPEKREEYMASEERLKLEYLRARLAGRPGLRQDGLRYAPPNGSGDQVPITKQRLAATLSYIGEISRYLPDRGIGMALNHRVSTVLEHLRRLREDSSTREASP
ncbi:MAG: hypothetical protein ACOC0O_06615, partial [Spirochaetota bacterium]